MRGTVTPTALRKNLFRTLRRVMHGETVIIETGEGEAMLTARTLAVPETRKNRPSAMEPKIPGRIVGSLESADAALRKYLRLPY